MSDESDIAFSMPGGEAAPVSDASRPIDMEHLARQTMEDRALEQEVLTLFIQQALGVAKKLPSADKAERLMLLHGLKGSARGVGAFAIAECASEIETRPDDPLLWKHLDDLVEAAADFIAAIGR